MRTTLTVAFALALGLGAYLAGASRQTQAAADEGLPLVHNVFFTLKESTPENRKKLTDACHKYLTKHPGEVYFAAGPLAEEFKRELNDRDFDVCLTIVFKNKAAHDTYQDAKRHIAFIDECKATWKKVRVFDSYAAR